MIPIIKLSTGDLVKLKKPHPCGGAVFRILRVGSQVRIVCTTCSRDMTLDRIKLEKSIKQFLNEDEIDQPKKEGGPHA